MRPVPRRRATRSRDRSATRRAAAAHRSRQTRQIAPAAGAATPSRNAARAPTLWDGLESRVPQRRGWASAEPRSISRAALPRTGLPCVRQLCTVPANPKTGPLRGTSDAGICDPDMESSTRQNNGEMFHKERAIQMHAAGDPAACIESTQPPRLTTTGDGPRRAGDRGGTQVNQQFRFDPQPPRLTTTGGAHEALQTFH